MNKLLKVVGCLAVLVIIIFIGLAVFIGTIDADKYRPQLVAALSKQIGRTVKLSGPMTFSLGLGGLHISIQDASIANPAWASRPLLAGMGKFELEVGLLPLLSQRLSINELSIENADILLETNASGQHNWDFAAPTAKLDQAPVPTTPASNTTQVSVVAPKGSLSINGLTIVNSQVAMRGVDGKVNSYNIASLTLGMRGTGAELKFKGDINGAEMTADAKTSITDLLSQAPFTFDLDINYNAINISSQGNADINNSRAEILAYALTAGKTKITGNLAATWNKSRPTLKGTLTSDHLDLADFKSGTTTPDSAQPAAISSQPQAASPSQRMFSDTPLPLAGLKAVDADFNVSIGEFPLGTYSLKQITAQLTLSNANLTLAPVKASVGSSPVDVQVKLNAEQSPPQLTIGIIANNVDLSDLQKLAGMSPFMTGNASANIQLTGTGDSPHDIAASLGGVVTVTAEKGKIITGAAANVSSLLAAVFNPQGGDDTLNCLAARFIAKNGTLTDNGILIDSTTSVVSGKGAVNLGNELVNLTLRAKTKLVDVGGLVPALQIGGTLVKPSYSVDAVGVVKNAIGNLLNGNPDFIESSVPDMQTAPAGQNACVFTLDHPKGAASTSSILPVGVISQTSQKIQNLGNSLIKGLFGQ